MIRLDGDGDVDAYPSRTSFPLPKTALWPPSEPATM